MRIPLVFSLIFAAALPGQAEPETPRKPAKKRASLEVAVRWDGAVPARKPLVLNAANRGFSDEAVRHCKKCVAEGKLWDETLLVSKKGGIRNVAVSLPRVLGQRTSRAVVKNTLPVKTLDNADCRFDPHIQFVPVGKTLRLENSDIFTHNARFAPKGKPSVWNGMVLPGRTVDGPRFLRAGIYVITCDAHPWMRGYAIASKTPHCGITDEEGTLTLTGVDADGPQTVIFWHESLGTARRQVDLKRGKTARIRLSQKDFR